MIGPLSTVLLIFGGCCSNVFALEAIIKSEPSSGLLITFFQFVFTTLASYPTQCSPGSPYTVRRPTVPLRRWVFIAALFFGINMLNNWAFAFSISVPVHIILRSFGSVTTMIMGVIRGKTYSALQVLSVMILTAGVLVSAWADSESKLMSAWSGAYVEDTYTMYKASWTENLFYSHVFSLPMFLPLSQTLRNQYARLAATPPLRFDRKSAIFEQQLGTVPDLLVDGFSTLGESMPRGILFLLVNATTQLACISGVNLLSSKSSAVTVTIILNIRKLVSFIFSTILFGHPMSAKMIAGSALVFGSGALYGYETSWRLPAQRRKDRMAGEAESVSTKQAT
ncbi:golgi uridine diphosphate-N-acetylglucosamine transporter [Elasticomyces elasticus]|nr:golgi uridine diphosphate-N-acetylglucosamine transporter [Elasticomyces elasticus]